MISNVLETSAMSKSSDLRLSKKKQTTDKKVLHRSLLHLENTSGYIQALIDWTNQQYYMYIRENPDCALNMNSYQQT